MTRVCCGPRCGAEPGHRGIYACLENALRAASIDIAPTQCQGECGCGVTVVDGPVVAKLRDRRDANQFAARILQRVRQNEECE